MASVSIFETNLFDLSDPNFFPWAFIFIAIGPFTWNIIARLEYKTRFFSNLPFFRGNRVVANYVLAFYILGIGFYRDYCFTRALSTQPRVTELLLEVNNVPLFYYLGALCVAVGQVLVLTSFYKLGFLGTFLGDYFGQLKDAPVTGFPFSEIVSNPMYMGATLTFGGSALMSASASGLVLTLWVYIVYRAALAFEEPFTGHIYRERDRARAAQAKKK